MSRPGWTTVAIPTDLYDKIKDAHVPGKAKSVQAYVHFWVRWGLMIDAAMDTSQEEDLVKRVMQGIEALRSGSL